MRGHRWQQFPAPALAIWLACGSVLAVVTKHVSDWFVMTDELLYERLALSIVRLHTPLPHVHGQSIPNVSQLYPLLLALPFSHGTVGSALASAHAFDAFVMSSVAVPAYLLALRVSGRVWAAALAAFLCVAVPWIVLSSFLLTEVAAYPAFVWAMLAFQACVARPSARNDVLAIVALIVAVLARAQLGVLAVSLALAVIAIHGRDLRGLWRSHRVLVVIYAVGIALVAVLTASGHNVAGTYTSATGGNPLPSAVWRSLLEHLAAVAVGLALLAPVVGGAWLVDAVRPARRLLDARAFALVAVPTIVLVALEAASYEVRFGGGVTRDRYVFYVAPLLLVAFAAALASERLPLWAPVLPVAVTCAGVALSPLPEYTKLFADSPASAIDNYLRSTLGGLDGARAFLAAAAVVAALLAVEVRALLRPRGAVAVLAVLALALACAQTSYAFVRLFRVPGTSGLPLTQDESNVFDWVDRTVGPGASVAMAPYPVVLGDYWASVGFWWDLEFWNRSVDRNVGLPGQFEGTPSTFPKTHLRFDRLGRANASPAPYVAQAVADTRFHIAGTVVTDDRGLFLVKTEQPWRADWLSAGLYDDGWTKPDAPATISVFGYPGQSGSLTRNLTVYVQSPSTVATRAFTLSSNLGRWQGLARPDVQELNASVCVPADGSATVTLSAQGQTQVYGDPRTAQTFSVPRQAGILVTRIYLSGQPGARCTARR